MTIVQHLKSSLNSDTSHYIHIRLSISASIYRGGGTVPAGPVLAGPLFGNQIINIQNVTHA